MIWCSFTFLSRLHENKFCRKESSFKSNTNKIMLWTNPQQSSAKCFEHSSEYSFRVNLHIPDILLVIFCLSGKDRKEVFCILCITAALMSYIENRIPKHASIYKDKWHWRHANFVHSEFFPQINRKQKAIIAK